jgi:hypothetical protein
LFPDRKDREKRVREVTGAVVVFRYITPPFPLETLQQQELNEHPLMFTFSVSGREKKNTPPFSLSPLTQAEMGVFSMEIEAEVGVEEEEKRAELFVVQERPLKEESFIFTSTVEEEREKRGRESFIPFHVTDVRYSFPLDVMEMRETEKTFSPEGVPPSLTRTISRSTVPDEEREKRGDPLFFSVDES